MPEVQFNELRKQLLRGGVAPRFVRRTILELSEHYSDIEGDALDSGASVEEAAAHARSVLGSEHTIAAAILARAELQDWTRQWPHVAACLRSLLLLVALPAAPVVYCVYRGPSIVRWSASVSLALLFTAGLLLGLRTLLLF